MIGAIGTVAVRGFTLGLDLRGGLEVVLKARPIHGSTISATTLQNAADVMRRRIDPHGILQPEIRTSTADNTIDISIPGVKNPNAVANLLVAGQLQAFNFYSTLTPVSRVSTFQANPQSLYQMLSAAKKQIPAKGTPAGWALFNASTHDLVARGGIRSRIEPQKRQVLNDIHLRTQPPGTVWLAVPHGDAAVSCDINTAARTSRAPPTRWSGTCSTCPRTTARSSPATRSRAPRPPPIRTASRSCRCSTRTAAAPTSTRSPASSRSRACRPDRALPNAIVVDNQLVAAPTINPQQFPDGIAADSISSPGSEITGLTTADASRIALEIQSGTLPVKFSPYSQQLVSASLGKDSLRNGVIAGIAGLAFVMIFLLLFYGFLGLIADIALVIYGVLLAGIVSALPVTMTLPGIAGTILTIGVAADANIVIFERVKEEVRAGKSMRAAIATGYRRGFHTIIDANVVTLIAAGVLYAAATSSVKGFALMLLIGVVTSIFTAVVFTRAMLGVLSGMQFMTSRWVLGSVGTGDRWKGFDFIGKQAGLVLDLGRDPGRRARSAWPRPGSTAASTSPAAAS